MTFIFHLMGASGSIRRTVRAADIREARAKLAPIPEDWSVISDASYRLGASFRPIGPATCVGCGQRYKEGAHDYCGPCRARRLSLPEYTGTRLANNQTRLGKRLSNARYLEKMTPEQRERKRRKDLESKRRRYWAQKAEQSELGL